MPSNDVGIYYRGKDRLGVDVWAVVVELPPGPKGERRQKTERIHGTKTEARRRRVALLHEIHLGNAPSDPGRLTVGEYLDRWLEDSARISLAAQSFSGYRAAVRRWKLELGGIRLTRLTAMQVQAAASAMSKSGLSPATVRRYHTTLHRALRQAVAWNILPKNPSDNITMPRAERKEMQALAPDEAVRLLGAAHGDPYGLLIILALGLGLRLGEVLGLQWGDFDLDAPEPVATIRRSMQTQTRTLKETKTGRVRRVGMPEFVRIALREELALYQERRKEIGPEWNPLGLVWCGPSGAAASVNSTEFMHRMCEAAKVPRVRFHDLRHTWATLLISDGADVKAVSEAAGHADVRITLQVYHHTLPTARQDMASRLDRKIGG